MRILVVDDHVETLRALRWLLVHRGHQVTTAETLSEARRLCDAGGLDLILCDLGLPDGDGRELAGVARRCGVRAVAISGYDRISMGDQAEPFWAYLTKPVSFERVTALLDAAAAGAATTA